MNMHALPAEVQDFIHDHAVRVMASPAKFTAYEAAKRALLRFLDRVDYDRFTQSLALRALADASKL